MYLNENETANEELLDIIRFLKEELAKANKQIEELKKANLSQLSESINKIEEIKEKNNQLNELRNKQFLIIKNSLSAALEDLFEKYPAVKEYTKFMNAVNQFNKNSETMIKSSGPKIITDPVKTENDSMRALLEKMQSLAKKSGDSGKVVKLERKITPEEREDKILQVKPIANTSLDLDDSFETIMEKFMEEEEEPNDAFGKLIIGDKNKADDNSFNLKEAVSTKDDLTEIMKSFDFFNRDD